METYKCIKIVEFNNEYSVSQKPSLKGLGFSIFLAIRTFLL